MSLIRGDALTIPLADNTVDLIVTSPPYFALRSYTDACGTCGGLVPDGPALLGPSDKSTLDGSRANRSGTGVTVEPDPDCPECEGSGRGHYAGQLGSEATPAAFIDALVSVTRECVRVLKPSGSLFVNLGDKYAGSSGKNNNGQGSSTLGHHKGGGGPHSEAMQHTSQPPAVDFAGIPTKSLMGLPWRYALACIDDLGLILRAEIIWSKPNGLPESVQDRVRRSHEQWFHFTLEPRYFSAVDEIREDYAPGTADCYRSGYGENSRALNGDTTSGVLLNQAADGGPVEVNSLGKLPGSVWSIPTEPLHVPDDLPQHFAAFPSEWPRRIILGWSPSGICTECGEGRRPTTDKQVTDFAGYRATEGHRQDGAGRDRAGMDTAGAPVFSNSVTITGESCACPTPTAPTRPAVVLDPFAGTGTTVAVANTLGRHGIGIDLSADYLRLARWRCQDPGLRAKVLRVDKPAPEVPGQMALL